MKKYCMPWKIKKNDEDDGGIMYIDYYLYEIDGKIIAILPQNTSLVDEYLIRMSDSLRKLITIPNKLLTCKDALAFCESELSKLGYEILSEERAEKLKLIL